MLTAGHTREAFNPVRFISNQSSRQIGFAKDKIRMEIVKNTDIVFEVAHMTKNCLFVVGFAAETHDMQKSAQQKLILKI